MDYIPVVFCFDAKYSQFAAVAIFSLYLSKKSTVKIYCIVPKEQLESIPAINWIRTHLDIHLEVIPFSGDHFRGWKEVYHIHRAAYLRLLIPDLLAEDKAIYLDSDVIVLRDIADLYALSLGDAVIGAVPDAKAGQGTMVPRDVSDVYINSGVLLLNLAAMREEKFLDKCESIYRQYERQIAWADQCIINKYAENRKLVIPRSWNVQVACQALDVLQWPHIERDSAVVHFVGSIKPWVSGAHPLTALFWRRFAEQLNTRMRQPIGSHTTSFSSKPHGLSPTISRNSPCPCGSGKRYKNCHGVL
jgi:lipopolysaccharide biosynthesis glycosyltransferase